MPVFDSGDVDYLLNTFDLPGLRRQLNACRVQESVCRTVGEDEWADVYGDLRGTFELAVDILLSQRPRPLATPSAPGQPTRIDPRDVKNHVDIVAVTGRYTTLKKSGNRFMGLCPLHADKRTPSFVVYPDRQTWHCFGACSRTGDVIDFIMAAERVDFKTAIGMLK